ncbi:transposase [Streptomyces sp. NPDC059918]|uniref:transposase n=1 Tax=unclassified Streptomyces TaxID=2593676 RepID=UPI00365CA1BC
MLDPGYPLFQFPLLAFDCRGPGRPAGRRCPARGSYPGRAPGVGGTYGVPRITAELRDDGQRVNHKRVARVMQSIPHGGAGADPPQSSG